MKHFKFVIFVISLLLLEIFLAKKAHRKFHMTKSALQSEEDSTSEKTKKSSFSTGPEIKILENTKLHHSQSLEAFEPCKLKQGVILLQKKLESNFSPIKLTVSPAFAVLNQQALTFFEAENVNSLILSHTLNSIFINNDEIFWKSSNCLPIFNQHLNEIITTMCFSEISQLEEWKNAISQLKEKCEVIEVEKRKIHKNIKSKKE